MNTHDEYSDLGYLGLDRNDAIRRAEEKNLEWRILEENGQSFIRTNDHKHNRINFKIQAGIIIGFEYG